MNRFFLVSLALITVAAGVFWKMGTEQQAEGLRSEASPVSSASPSPAELQGLALAQESAPDASLSANLPRATRWIVEVVDGEGEAVPDAQISAVQGKERLVAQGKADWTSPRVGVWTLTVTGLRDARWQRRIDMALNDTRHTRVVLGAQFEVQGRVRDHLGDPRHAHLIGFVPEGGPAPTRPQEWLGLPHGRTGKDGSFRASLPHSGTWRLFVGYAGKIVHEETQAIDLSPRGPLTVDVVVQAPTRLVIEVLDAEGEPSAGRGVSVYRLASILDIERPLAAPAPAPPPVDLDDPSLSAEDRSELEHVLKSQSELTPEQQAIKARNLQVVPEGWRMDRSGLVNREGRMLLEFLPVDEELRFAASRASEAFRVEGSAWAKPLVPTLVRILLPPPLPAGTPIGAEPRSVQATVETMTLSESPLPLGCTWQ